MESELNNVRNIYYPVKNEHYGRVGHRVISISRHIYIFGGLNAQNDYNTTTMRLDCDTMTVDLLPTKNTLKLQGFSLLAYNNEIFLWGGSGPYRENPKFAICSNNLLRFTGDSFMAVEQRGTVPSAREYHASCMYKGRYLIITGGNNGKQFFNDWHLLDCFNFEWTRIAVINNLPPTLGSLIFWKAGRGFLMTGENFMREARELQRDNRLYSFRFSDFKSRILELQELSVDGELRQRNPRGSPVGVLAGLQSLYIILVGGQIYKDGGVVTFCSTVDCLNVQTLEWHAIELVPQAACSFEALYFDQKIYLLGGISSNRELNQYTEFIDLKVDFIEAKICKVCRELYGLKELPQDKTMNIKFEAQLAPRTFFNCEIISRMASYITYPFSALGLLIDNSLNLSATHIQILFGLQGSTSKERQPLCSKSQAIVPYSYLAVLDNSFGFSQNEILECLCSFTVKTEKYTSDKRYEQEIQIRKQYGINLKLGALRLGKSCLYTTKTEDNSRLVAYFSCACQGSKEDFTIFSYFLNSDGTCSSEINRRIIHHNVKEKLPANYQSGPTTTAVYIFDMDNKELLVSAQRGEISISHQEAPNRIFRALPEYLESLYLQPYTGRKISINKKELKCRNYSQLLRKDQVAGKIVKIGQELPREIVTVCHLYRVVDEGYFFRNILFYHKNRLLFVMNRDDRYCGVVQLNERISVDLCKTKIQNRSEQITFTKGIKSFLARQQEKRLSEPSVLSQPTKLKESSRPALLQGGQADNRTRAASNTRLLGDPKK